MNKHFTVFTDASYCSELKMASFGVIVQSSERIKSYSNKKFNIESSEAAEIGAIEYALTILPRGSTFTLFNDNKTVIDFLMFYQNKKQKHKRKVRHIIKMKNKFEKVHFEWMTDIKDNFIRECHNLAKKESKN